MTISEAITTIDAIKPNQYSRSDKIRWLATLDGLIKAEIIDTHESDVETVFTPYDDNTDPNTELLVPAPYDEIYIHWLEAQIDYTNGEYDKYENSNTMFNTSYTAYANHYNRTHMPLGKKFKFF